MTKQTAAQLWREWQIKENRTHHTIDDWPVQFAQYVIESQQENPEVNCVECGGGPCRVWPTGIEACGGTAAMGAESSGAVGHSAFSAPPLRNEHASCNCNIAHDGPCPSNLTQGELLRRVTRPSPNRTNEPDSDYED